jgi:uncharacterized membrane protein
MRQLQLRVHPDQLDRALSLAEEHGAASATAIPVQRLRHGSPAADERILVIVDLPNSEAGHFVEAVRGEVRDATFILVPVGTIPLHTPLEEVDPRVEDVSRLSTLELVLASLQSVGSWRGLLIYAVLAGLIGGYGVIFGISYLLVAAMLINPMGAPALVSVIGLAIGDGRMFARGTGRFVVALAVQSLAAMLLAVMYRLQVSPPMVEQVTSLSVGAAIVALAAGAAGAHTQVKSDRDSLISGTAAGFMVAAALAPPAAVLGISLPIARWDYAAQVGFILVLQYFAIALGGWVVLRFYGVVPGEPSIGRGSVQIRTVLLAGLFIGMAALVGWQIQAGPAFRKADVSRDALAITRSALATVPTAALVEAETRFTRPDLARQRDDVLLVDVIVESLQPEGEGATEQRVREAIQAALERELAPVVALVRVSVIPSSSAPAGRSP